MGCVAPWPGPHPGAGRDLLSTYDLQIRSSLAFFTTTQRLSCPDEAGQAPLEAALPSLPKTPGPARALKHCHGELGAQDPCTPGESRGGSAMLGGHHVLALF